MECLARAFYLRSVTSYLKLYPKIPNRWQTLLTYLFCHSSSSFWQESYSSFLAWLAQFACSFCVAFRELWSETLAELAIEGTHGLWAAQKVSASFCLHACLSLLNFLPAPNNQKKSLLLKRMWLLWSAFCCRGRRFCTFCGPNIVLTAQTVLWTGFLGPSAFWGNLWCRGVCWPCQPPF